MFDESREDNSVCSLRDSGAGIYVSVFCGYTSRHQERQKEEYTMSQSTSSLKYSSPYRSYLGTQGTFEKLTVLVIFDSETTSV